jgi:hypothetical protein
MTPKPKRSWFDIQLTLMAVSLASALGLWNLFAGPDRETALRKAVEAQASQPDPVLAPPTQEAPVSNASLAQAQVPVPEGKILLGGVAPQTKVVVQAKRDRGGGGGGSPGTTTGSS